MMEFDFTKGKEKSYCREPVPWMPPFTCEKEKGHQGCHEGKVRWD
jgi:hypothetical protein